MKALWRVTRDRLNDDGTVTQSVESHKVEADGGPDAIRKVNPKAFGVEAIGHRFMALVNRPDGGNDALWAEGIS